MMIEFAYENVYIGRFAVLLGTSYIAVHCSQTSDVFNFFPLFFFRCPDGSRDGYFRINDLCF